MDSETLGLRSQYYLGMYDDVLKEAKEMKSSSSNENVDIYYFRALLEKTPEVVVRGIPSRASTALQAIKQYATYVTSPQEGKELVLETLGQWLEDESMKQNVTLQLVAAQIYIREENYRAALPLVHGDRENLDKMALAVHIFLKLDRPDLAQRVAEAMLVEDDDVLTILSSAYVAVALGQEAKLEQAKLNLEELTERYGPSILVYNALASCMIMLRKFPAAFAYLKNARDQAKKQNIVTPAETLINTSVCLQHMNKTQFIPNIITELETSHPNHPWLQSQRELDESFTKCAASFS